MNAVNSQVRFHSVDAVVENKVLTEQPIAVFRGPHQPATNIAEKVKALESLLTQAAGEFDSIALASSLAEGATLSVTPPSDLPLVGLSGFQANALGNAASHFASDSSTAGVAVATFFSSRATSASHVSFCLSCSEVNNSKRGDSSPRSASSV